MGLIDKVFSAKPSQGEFAKLVSREFAKSGLPNLEYNEAEFAFKIPDRGTTIYLSNTYANYCAVPRNERQKVISRLVAGFTTVPDIPKDFSSAKRNLMPAVRDVSYDSLGRLLNAKRREDSGLEWQYKPLAGSLIVGLVYDTEHNITTVNQKTIAEWGVGLDEALAIAKENLWDRTDPKRFTGQNGVYWGEWGDSYDSSRILLTEFIYRLELDGDPVAFVPNRDSLMVTGKNSTAGLRAILTAGAENHFKTGHPLSPDLFVLEDGLWKTFVPEDASLKEIWRSMRRNRDALDYSQQKQLLDKLPEDVFIANCALFKDEGGAEFSVCVWTKDVDSSLPRTDFIVFMVDPAAKDHFMVPWEKAWPLVESLLEQETELIPARYRARQFPSDDQIAELQKLRVN